jgi:hypothetical protein
MKAFYGGVWSREDKGGMGMKWAGRVARDGCTQKSYREGWETKKQAWGGTFRGCPPESVAQCSTDLLQCLDEDQGEIKRISEL